MNLIQRALGYIGYQKAAAPNQAWSQNAELWHQLGGDIRATGRTATAAPVEAAISLISQDIATLDITVLEDRGNGRFDKIMNSPVWRVLQKPNDYQTRYDFMVTMIRDVMLYGNFYAWADRDRRGQITALYPLLPRQVQGMITPDGSIYYSVALSELEAGEGPKQMNIPAKDMFHHRVFTSRHPLLGISPLYALGNTATLNAAITENMARFHQNNSRPGGILTIPGGLKQEARERLRTEFTKVFSGEGAGKTAVLDFDAKYDQLGYSAREATVNELLSYTVEETCRALRIPKHMLMSGDSGATAAVETQMRIYYSHCLRPWIEALENRMDDFFGFTGTTRRVEFEVDGLFRAEMNTRVEALTKAVQGGIMTPNEARSTERLAPVEGGDDAFLQKQMVPVSLISQMAAQEMQNQQQQNEPQEEPQEEPDSEEVSRSILKLIGTPKVLDEEIVSKIMNEVRHG